MTIIQPELSRRISVNRIGAGDMEQTIEANAAERRALAERLQIPAIASFSCRFRLSPPLRGQVAAVGELRAEITQVCVVSLEPFEATVSERFALRFVPEGAEEDDLNPESPDELPYAGDVIDLGETASEQLALALDPYPRMPGIALPTEIANTAADGPAADAPSAGPPVGDKPIRDEPGRPHPFAALASLRGGKEPRNGGDA